jgi:dTDP-4-amino-4,6-dideoxygalactose transaminase
MHSISTLIHYPVPVHLQRAYQDRIRIGEGGLRETEQACGEILSLPIHPQLSDTEIGRVGQLIALSHEKTLAQT